MTPQFRHRRRAEEFAALVDAPVGVASAGDQGRLLAVVAELREQGGLAVGATPKPAFSTDLRARLLAEASETSETSRVPQALLPVPDRPRTVRQRRLVAAATATIVLGGTAGMASAAQGALPGEALYPVKRGIEQVQVGLAGSSLERGRQLLEQASTRLEEVQGLLDSGPVMRATQIPHTLQDFSRQAGEGADLLLRSYRDTGNPGTVATVRAFAKQQLQTLTGIAGVTPPKAHQDLVVAATTLGSIDGDARGVCEDCTDIPALQVPAPLTTPAVDPEVHPTGAGEVTTPDVTGAPPARAGDDLGIDLIDLAPPSAAPPLDLAVPRIPALEPPTSDGATTPVPAPSTGGTTTGGTPTGGTTIGGGTTGGSTTGEATTGGTATGGSSPGDPLGGTTTTDPAPSDAPPSSPAPDDHPAPSEPPSAAPTDKDPTGTAAPTQGPSPDESTGAPVTPDASVPTPSVPAPSSAGTPNPDPTQGQQPPEQTPTDAASAVGGGAIQSPSEGPSSAPPVQ